MLKVNRIYNMNCLEGLRLLLKSTINCCVTSPPYFGLRDYGIKPSKWPAVSYYPMTGVSVTIDIPEWEGCLGLEPTVEMYVGHIVLIFREVYRVLRKDGVLWLNINDSYVGTGGDRKNPVAREIFNIQQSRQPKSGRYEKNQLARKSGLKQKDLMGVPWRVAFALQADGWYLRIDDIWNKTNCMPESATDRPTRCHEYVFLCSKSKKYYFDHKSIMEPCVDGDPNPPRGSEGVLGNKNQGRRGPGNWGIKPVGLPGECENRGQSGVPVAEKRELRNKRSVWSVATDNFKEAHFATFPPKLIEPCIIAGCPVGGKILDPFMGSGTTAMVSIANQRNYIGFEMNPEYIKLADEVRTNNVQIKMTL